MNPVPIVVPGTVRPDGTLELRQPVPLPPGPVEVTVRALAPAREDTGAVLQAIWEERRALGLRGRTREEIDATSELSATNGTTALATSDRPPALARRSHRHVDLP
jgi:hypothetical protein